jgi:DNA polymerase elongation subunit (family B)
MYQNIFYNRENGVVHIWDDIAGYKKFRNRPYCYKKVNYETDIKSIYGDMVEKIAKNRITDSDVLFESDLNTELKILRDFYPNDVSVAKNKICYTDIEVDVSGGYPDFQTANKEIISIACFDQSTLQKIAFFTDPNKRFTLINSDTTSYVICKDEKDILLKYIAYIRNNKFTILSGYNCESFDFPYILKRGMQIIGEVIQELSPIQIVEEVELKFVKKVKIAGVSILDILSLYKKYSQGDRVSYSLDNISQLELGERKTEYSGSLGKLFQTDLNKFIEYNINDAELCYKLEKKLSHISTCIAFAHKAHIPYEEIFSQSKILEGVILLFLRENKLVAPNRSNGAGYVRDKELGKIIDWKKLKQNIIVEKIDNDFEDEYNVEFVDIDDDTNIQTDINKKFKIYQLKELLSNKEITINTVGSIKLASNKARGAYVKDPQRGRYNWIIDLDYTSMYPNIMRSLNISPETKIGKVLEWQNKDTISEFTIECNDKKYKASLDQIKSFLNTNKFCISSNGIIYDTNQKGVMHAILTEWFNNRVEYRKLSRKFFDEGNDELGNYYNMQQYILKILLNSMFGVLLNPGFRFYDKDNGEATTITGRELIQYAEKMANQFLNEYAKTENIDYVVTMDTDSLFLNVDGICKTKDDVIKLTPLLQNYVNASMDNFASNMGIIHHYFDMKQELIAKSGIFIQKKRYILDVIDRDHRPVEELDIKGIEIVRTNFPQYFRDKLKYILQLILDKADRDSVNAVISKIRDEMLVESIENISIPTGVGQVTKYTDSLTRYKKGAPAHSKAAINHNIMLANIDLNREFEPIYDKSKIRYAFLKKDNLYQFDTMAFKEDSHPDIIDYVKTNIDYDHIFDSIMTTKIGILYNALNWELPEFLLPKPKEKKEKKKKTEAIAIK